MVTGDTSIKHMANATPTKVIELCQGWSDYRRTGIYKQDSIILTGTIAPDKLANICHARLQEDWASIERTADFMNIHRTRELNSGFWYAQALTEAEQNRTVATLIERCAWKITLNRNRQREFSEFG